MSDDQDEARDILPQSMQSGRAHVAPSAGLRQRPVNRAGTFTDGSPQFARRSSSFISETLSESRRSFRSSTDDLFLPRASADHDNNLESSHWHSLPLGLALLPAVGGLFFQNGSAFVTDISLLGLAALFLNWAVRLPWDWYLSAQAVVAENEIQELGSPFEDDNSEVETPRASSPQGNIPKHPEMDRIHAARSELRAHELLALAACFAFPALGAWLLHAIRSQLSRPSEGLVSDYNLTIFILAAEVRPLSHLIKLVQRRTLFLQRTISSSTFANQPMKTDHVVLEITQRLEDIEAHIANSVLLSLSPSSENDPAATLSTAEDLVAKASLQANVDIRKTMQPELDALNRAMRRYEKRFTISATQIESRLQELESRMQDTIILAAATQRNANKQMGKYTPVLLNWVSALIVVPVRYAIHLITLPQRALTVVLNYAKQKLGMKVIPPAAKGKEGKGSSTSRSSNAQRQRVKEKSKISSAQ